ncbi:MAG TPA: choice-of-anchor tandem repeat GloVer-containing protein [Bacteroidia bacterium]|nr:choice-of-anchor tandem repeat GloVer-containing protein [Bacteroidia bacterium]
MIKLFTLSLYAFTLSLFTYSYGQYKVLLNFNGSNGDMPLGSLTAVGDVLYGTTLDGGTNNDGCIFSIDTNGTGYKNLHSFDNTNGGGPEGSLTYSAGKFYATTFTGGSNNYGCIFTIDTDGSGYKVIHNFDNSGGSNPYYGRLALRGKTLYGVAGSGGANGIGCIYSVDTDGTNYTDLHDFSFATGGLSLGEVTLRGNKLYGMTSAGGANGWGCMFSIDTNGAGYTDIYDFTFTGPRTPQGNSLIVYKNKMYGMTTEGGANNDGAIFSIDTSGSNFIDLFDFSATNGEQPYGDLRLLGGKLCGMATNGGISNIGCIFSMDTNGMNFKDNHDFYGSGGEQPYGSLTLLGNAFYGMTSSGGTSYDGLVFKFDTISISSSVDILQATYGSVTCYPNPSTGKFTLQSSAVSTQCAVEVYNGLGQKIYSGILPQTPVRMAQPGGPKGVLSTIDLSGQPSGVYLYRIIAADGGLLGEGKLVIQK